MKKLFYKLPGVIKMQKNINNYNEKDVEVKELSMEELEEEFIRECVMSDSDWDEYNELCLEHVGY
jgi:hypothetical protein